MVCPTTAFATWDSTNLCVVLSFIFFRLDKGAAEREDWRGKNTENKTGEEAVLGETVLETTGEEAWDETVTIG